jgi:DUF1680 family protein
MPVSKELLTLHPIAPGAVRLSSGFWGDRQLQNRHVTIPYGMKMMEETGTLENFRLAAGRSGAEYHLPLFRDSDLYKVLEAIAWERDHGPDPEQEKFFRGSAELLQAAQEPDGYLNSFVHVVQGGRRFEDPAMGHELYCAGHLFQAAVADARTAHGPAQLSPVAERFASMLVQVMRSEQARFVEGHPEVETALVELYRTGGDRRLLELAGDLVARRGHRSLTWRSFGPSYFQDDVPFEEATSIRGHAVRALYLLAGATDVYTEIGGAPLRASIFSQWYDMTSAKTYLTGGVGSRHDDEAFGERFELPPDRAYCERCAAIASIMWNWRLLLLTGEARFAELIERTLYNGFLAGIGLDGTSFLLREPAPGPCPHSAPALVSTAPAARPTACACLPASSTTSSPRPATVSSSTSTRRAGCTAGPALKGRSTCGGDGLPLWWHGWRSGSTPRPVASREISLRVPSWATAATTTLNGRPMGGEPGTDGYLRFRREWSVGDELVLEFPLRPRVVRASDEVDGARGCVAFERGRSCTASRAATSLTSTACGDISVLGREPKEDPGLRIGDHQMVALKLQGRAQRELRWLVVAVRRSQSADRRNSG